MKFLCELKQVKQTKLVSLDNQYELRLFTDDSHILDLGKFPADTLFEVEMKAQPKVKTNPTAEEILNAQEA